MQTHRHPMNVKSNPAAERALRQNHGWMTRNSWVWLLFPVTQNAPISRHFYQFHHILQYAIFWICKAHVSSFSSPYQNILQVFNHFPVAWACACTAPHMRRTSTPHYTCNTTALLWKSESWKPALPANIHLTMHVPITQDMWDVLNNITQVTFAGHWLTVKLTTESTSKYRGHSFRESWFTSNKNCTWWYALHCL